jgi:hypothetical protein
MWHFGKDSMEEYTGKGFNLTWGYGRESLIRVYSKVLNTRKTKLRIETQEYPKKMLEEALSN